MSAKTSRKRRIDPLGSVFAPILFAVMLWVTLGVLERPLAATVVVAALGIIGGAFFAWCCFWPKLPRWALFPLALSLPVIFIAMTGIDGYWSGQRPMALGGMCVGAAFVPLSTRRRVRRRPRSAPPTTTTEGALDDR